MGIQGIVHGFSKLSREDQIQLLREFTGNPVSLEAHLNDHRLQDSKWQGVYDSFSENAVSNFFLPYCIAPNFRIDNRFYFVPMVTEESSVVAAASSAAKFWSERGGFHTRVSSVNKPGHIHFTWNGSPEEISSFVTGLIPGLHKATSMLTRNMKKRGGGITDIQLIDRTATLEGYYQIEVMFNTVDSMGANFINSCLERMAAFIGKQVELAGISDRFSIVMAILSNYTPQCTVECSIACDPDRLSHPAYGMNGLEFARKFEFAVNISRQDTHRAVTHNKGIYNGIDAVVIATGNDFRAVEADGHAFAARDGKYRGLTEVEVYPDSFSCKIEIPISIGTIGGLTRLHPLAAVSLEILGNPDVPKLMSIASAAGLACNFSAVRSLITGGIQSGHMHMHLSNILHQLQADPEEKKAAVAYFREHTVSYAEVEVFLTGMRTRVAQTRKR